MGSLPLAPPSDVMSNMIKLYYTEMVKRVNLEFSRKKKKFLSLILYLYEMKAVH